MSSRSQVVLEEAGQQRLTKTYQRLEEVERNLCLAGTGEDVVEEDGTTGWRI